MRDNVSLSHVMSHFFADQRPAQKLSLFCNHGDCGNRSRGERQSYSAVTGAASVALAASTVCSLGLSRMEPMKKDMKKRTKRG